MLFNVHLEIAGFLDEVAESDSDQDGKADSDRKDQVERDEIEEEVEIQSFAPPEKPIASSLVKHIAPKEEPLPDSIDEASLIKLGTQTEVIDAAKALADRTAETKLILGTKNSLVEETSALKLESSSLP